MTLPPHVIEAGARMIAHCGQAYQGVTPESDSYAVWEALPDRMQELMILQAKMCLESALQAMWQPIESAPKNDDFWPILVCKAGCQLSFPAYWLPSIGWLSFEDYFDEVEEPTLPTHWMPLPTPPEGT